MTRRVWIWGTRKAVGLLGAFDNVVNVTLSRHYGKPTGLYEAPSAQLHHTWLEVPRLGSSSQTDNGSLQRRAGGCIWRGPGHRHSSSSTAALWQLQSGRPLATKPVDWEPGRRLWQWGVSCVCFKQDL